MNELMNEQSLSVGRRLLGSLGEADIHFLGVGWDAGTCFPAVSPGSAATRSLPFLLTPHPTSLFQVALLFLATFFFPCSIYSGKSF